MNWWILTIVLVVVCVVSIVVESKTLGVWSFISSIFSGSIAIITLLICILGTVSVPKEIMLFQSQKQYIESHIPDDPVENAAITNKKIELNEWLFNAKYSNERWGGWSFYPDSVQDIEPIE